MKEIIIRQGPKAELVESAMPVAAPGQVVIKVAVAGANPKDWKIPMWFNRVVNEGEDIAGTIHALGEGVLEFKVFIKSFVTRCVFVLADMLTSRLEIELQPCTIVARHMVPTGSTQLHGLIPHSTYPLMFPLKVSGSSQ